MSEASPTGEPSAPSSGSSADGVQAPGPLLSEVAGALAALLSAKLRLARHEISRDGAALVSILLLLSVSVLILSLCLLFVGIGAVRFLEPWLPAPGLAWLVVGSFYLAAGLLALFAALRRFRRIKTFLRASRQDLDRDLEWIRKQI